MSSKQLPALEDQEDDGGKYMPLRKTKLGNFDLPLYTHPAPQQKPMTEYERAVMYAALSCVELQEKDPATMFKMIVEGVERFHNIGEKK